jgi:hypothetical protein
MAVPVKSFVLQSQDAAGVCSRLKMPAGYNIAFSNHGRSQKVSAMAPTSESNAGTQAGALSVFSEIVGAERQGHHVR